MQETRTCEIPVEGIDLIYEIFQANDLDQAISCMVDTFTRHEPMTKALEITPNEFYPFASLFCRKAIKGRLSLVSKERKTGKVVAFHVADDFMAEPPEGIERVNERFLPILALLNELDEEYKKTNRVAEGEFLHLFMGGACGGFRNRKIVTALVERHLRLARKKNFLGVIAEVTGPISRHILVDTFAFMERARINYKSYVYNGKKVFANIEDSSECILVEKRF
jgi:hypothetical protein